jgi:uncharacterized protein (TIGR00369 family)
LNGANNLGGPVDRDGTDRPSPDGRVSSDAPRVPFLELLGARPLELRPGWCRIELPVSRCHLRGLSIIHGGAVATLLDSAMGLAASTSTDAGQGVVTVQLNANFIRPAREGETLVATGELKHSGRRTAVACGEVHTAEGALVASGSATFVHLTSPDTSADGTAASRPGLGLTTP